MEKFFRLKKSRFDATVLTFLFPESKKTERTELFFPPVEHCPI
jgi:hypothetical protein